VQVEEKATRLRTQVGNSYRELLGTADTIVGMRRDNETVQDLLGQMGGRCGRAVVHGKAHGLAEFVAKDERHGAAESAKLKLLDSCLQVGGRILKGSGGLPEGTGRGDRLVLATKVWVISRLLLKSLGEDNPSLGSRKSVQLAAKMMTSLRQRILRGIKKVLERTDEDVDREDILKALCAYSLATSSGAADVLRHFLSVREEAMGVAFELEEGERERTTDDVFKSLRLYTRTILDVQALVPAKLSPALLGLKSQPLLEDATLKRLEGLRLDIYERWCGDDISHFTPFIRHDNLDGKQAKDRLSVWTKSGAEVLLDGLKKTLAQMADFKSIVELRTGVLQLWIRDGGRAKGFDPLEMQDDLRSAINARLLAVLVSKVGKLRLVGSEVKATLESWEKGIADKHVGLWDEDGYDTAFAQGATPFIEEVISRLYGRNDAVSRALNGYKSWFHVIDDVKDVVAELQKQRWDNDYDEIEDEETIEARQQLLSKDDPKMLQNRLDSALDKSFRELQEHLEKLWEERKDKPASSAIAMYYLRVLRDIRTQLPERKSVEGFGLKMVPELQEQVVLQVSQTPLQHFADNSLSQRRAVTRPLWDGEPPLPSQPSPGVFQFLRDLSLSMSDAGMDLWTPAAAAVMKKRLSEQLCEKWSDALKAAVADESGGDSKKVVPNPKKTEKQADGGDDSATANAQDDEGSGEEEKNDEESNKEDLYIQWAFDIGLLRECVASSSTVSCEDLDKLSAEVYKHAPSIDDAARKRIDDASKNFWQRTSLLFGLLA
jgi:hypothetical protein